MIKNDDRFGNPDSPPVIDLVYDGTAFTELYGKRIHTVHTHGTGRTFCGRYRRPGPRLERIRCDSERTLIHPGGH